MFGQWINESVRSDYHIINFRKEGYLSFYCRSDTLFSIKYSINNDTVFLIPVNEPIYKHRILKLTSDSLILESLYKSQKL